MFYSMAGIYTNSQSISNKEFKSTLYGEDDDEEEMYKGYKDVQQMEVMHCLHCTAYTILHCTVLHSTALLHL